MKTRTRPDMPRRCATTAEIDFGGGAVRGNADLNARIVQSTPPGRAGMPEDVEGTVATLLSHRSGCINGQRIEVAGGIHG